MITPINNFQPIITFQGAKLKTPKNFRPLKNQPIINKTSEKFSKFIEKAKCEFENMDQETEELLFKTIALGTALAVAIGVIVHYVNAFIDKIQNLFQ